MTTTPKRSWLGRVGPRGLIILRAGGWSLTAKAIAAVNLFVTFPFVMRSLGAAEFGVWATLVSVITFVGFLDFGIGNGAMNMIADARGRKRDDEIAAILREAARTLMTIAAIMLIGVVFAAFLPWWRILRLPAAEAAQARVAALVVLTVATVSVPLSLATRAQLGLGMGHVAFRWQAVGQGVALIATIFAALIDAGLAWLVAASLTSTVVPAVLNGVSLWRHPLHGNRRPVACAARPDIRARIRRDGALFFALQLGGALAFTIDLPLIAAIRGPAEAGEYAVVQRLFSLISLSLSLIWVPLWPVYRHAMAASENAWVSRTLVWTLGGAGAFALLIATAFAGFFPWIATFWLHREFTAPAALLVGFVVWSALDALGQAFATFLNAAGILTFQVAVAVALSILALTLKVLGLSFWGISVVPWCTATAYVLASVIPTLMRLPALLRQGHAVASEARGNL
ncbi:Membrane protein involved in the export of O-antigen and teichoic acid [Luteibacter sp. UNCMF331Sha3.1]|uniref:lipopolysaccharide biosynthesis protein n=1 Tax=Luteibacter sp. UNCMF331Sha3.1 TaxID=1502760 RepID=UPI0008B66834|nr:oligosaccharide flippase family protein [Luteibacter sp. UNCMF331Sha3.1]SEM92528.1 Membrane protein involved in the export of O-antigen and teichoic acid [Luteibacter sp. UNCMF331Sha3.1]